LVKGRIVTKDIFVVGETVKTAHSQNAAIENRYGGFEVRTRRREVSPLGPDIGQWVVFVDQGRESYTLAMPMLAAKGVDFAA
jgi:hypothetical protein